MPQKVRRVGGSQAHQMLRTQPKQMNIATEATQDKGENPAEDKDNMEAQGHQLLPPNYSASFEFVKLVSKTMFIILGLGSTNIRKLLEKKQKHTWSVQVMNELLQRACKYEYEYDGRKPRPTLSEQEEDSQETKPYGFGSDAGDDSFFAIGEAALDSIDKPVSTNNASRANQKEKEDAKNAEDGKGHPDMQDEVPEMKRKESPILIATKNGITEIVEKVLETFPVAIDDMNCRQKNAVLLAVENRQTHVYQLLLKIPNILKESVFRKVDYEGNSALHLAASLGKNKPRLVAGAALQMQWEIKWYKFVKESMDFNFFVRYNKQNKSSKEIFTESHKELKNAADKWLDITLQSCSVVATLIASVTFATSATVPGGFKEETGMPTLENQPALNLFAISSLVAFYFSAMSLIMFLAIMTSRYREKDFGKDLLRKLILDLTLLVVSIASMLIAFCAGNFFVLKNKLKYVAWPVYVVTCLLITLFTITQFSLYFDLIQVTFKKAP